MNYILVLKLVVLILAAGTMGFVIGRRTAHKPAGRIVFEKQEDGHELCIFKLREDEEWIAKQKTVIFEVLHVGEDFTCAPYKERDDEER